MYPFWMSLKMLLKRVCYDAQWSQIQHTSSWKPETKVGMHCTRTGYWLHWRRNARSSSQRNARDWTVHKNTNYRNKELSNNLKHHTCNYKHHKQLQKPEQRIFRAIVTKYYVCSAENDISKFSFDDLPDLRMLGRRGLTAQIDRIFCCDCYYYANFPLN